MTGIGPVSPYPGPVLNYDGWQWRFHDNGLVYGTGYVGTPLTVMYMGFSGVRISETNVIGTSLLQSYPFEYYNWGPEDRILGKVNFQMVDNPDGSITISLDGTVPISTPTP